MTNTHESLALQTWLPSFFTDYQACRTPPVAPKPKLVTWLSSFFSAYQACRTTLLAHANKPEPKAFQMDAARLAHWLADMMQPMEDARRGAFHFDPWQVAGLGRDEVRNSAVLAWLLNPQGSHGLGDAAMLGLLGNLRRFDSRFPSHCSAYCRVRVESNPDGDRGNRVDIEIDDVHFYALIEVKLGAPEGEEQLKRYGDISKQLAGARPWALVFLTPRGVKSNTAGHHADRVLPMSWQQLAFSVAQSVKASSAGPLTTRGPARHMAEQSVQRFLKQIRNF